MPNDPTPPETAAATGRLLGEALAYLKARGIFVTLDGDPLRYWIAGEAFTEERLIAFAAQVVALGQAN